MVMSVLYEFSKLSKNTFKRYRHKVSAKMEDVDGRKNSSKKDVMVLKEFGVLICEYLINN